jgi:hypothetical protein
MAREFMAESRGYTMLYDTKTKELVFLEASGGYIREKMRIAAKIARGPKVLETVRKFFGRNTAEAVKIRLGLDI